jgi:hypothetical protein
MELVESNTAEGSAWNLQGQTHLSQRHTWQQGFLRAFNTKDRQHQTQVVRHGEHCICFGFSPLDNVRIEQVKSILIAI